jgi:hypothetical protein
MSGALGDGALAWNVLQLALGSLLLARAVWEYRQQIIVSPDELVVRSWRRPLAWSKTDLTGVEVAARKPRGLSRLRVTARDGQVWSGGPKLNEVEASDLRAELARAGYPLTTPAFPLPQLGRMPHVD